MKMWTDSFGVGFSSAKGVDKMKEIGGRIMQRLAFNGPNIGFFVVVHLDRAVIVAGGDTDFIDYCPVTWLHVMLEGANELVIYIFQRKNQISRYLKKFGFAGLRP